MYIFLPFTVFLRLGLGLSSVSAPWSSAVRRWRPPAWLRCGGPACVQHVLLALRATAAERMVRIGASLVALRSSRSAVLGGGGAALAVDDVVRGVPDEQASSAAGSGLRPPYRRLVPAGALFWAVFFRWGRRVPSATTSLEGDCGEVTVLSELRFGLDRSIVPGGFPIPVDVVVKTSFVAKGERLLSSPVLRVSSGLLSETVAADFSSGWWSDGCRSGLFPLPLVLTLIHLLWRKEDLVGLHRSMATAGVEDDGGDISGCGSLYRGADRKSVV